METISYELVRVNQLHEEITNTTWGYPEGLRIRQTTTSAGSASFFQIKNNTSHVVQIKKRCILHLHWMQAVVSETTQRIKVMIRDQDISYERVISSRQPELLSLDLNIGFPEILNPPFDLLIEIVHSDPLTFLEGQRLDLTILS